MPRRIAHLLLVALAFLHAASGCGNRLQSGTKRFADPTVRMGVSPFSNRAAIPEAGARVAERLREELRRSGFRGSFGAAGGTFLIEGPVREIREDVFSHGADRFALENRLPLVLDTRAGEVLRGGVRWKESGL